jgi:DNA-binding XRE family transcriptional regulator
VVITHYIIFFPIKSIHNIYKLRLINLGNRNIIGKNINLIRKRKEITQEQLTARLNVQGIEIDRPMISKIERQTREILDYEIKAIAIALGVTIEDLFKE